MLCDFTDDDKFEVEVKSDLNSEIQKLIPNAEDLHRRLQQFIDDILDQTVAKTDMKLRHIVTKGIEVTVPRQTSFILPVTELLVL